MKSKIKRFIAIIIIAISGALSGCSGMSKQETIQTVEAQEATLESSQDAVNTTGTTVKGEVKTASTTNNSGVPVHWFIIGSIIFGWLIPAPRFLRRIF